MLATWVYSDIASTPSSSPSLRIVSISMPASSASAMAVLSTWSRFKRRRAATPVLLDALAMISPFDPIDNLTT